jgi:hypothetical protein
MGKTEAKERLHCTALRSAQPEKRPLRCSAVAGDSGWLLLLLLLLRQIASLPALASVIRNAFSRLSGVFAP